MFYYILWFGGTDFVKSSSNWCDVFVPQWLKKKKSCCLPCRADGNTAVTFVMAVFHGSVGTKIALSEWMSHRGGEKLLSVSHHDVICQDKLYHSQRNQTVTKSHWPPFEHIKFLHSGKCIVLPASLLHILTNLCLHASLAGCRQLEGNDRKYECHNANDDRQSNATVR